MPNYIDYVASINAFIPEAQALLMQMEGVSSFTPAPNATYLSGA